VDESQALFAGGGANGGEPWRDLVSVLVSNWQIRESCLEGRC
jgi:hypothetical protein